MGGRKDAKKRRKGGKNEKKEIGCQSAIMDCPRDDRGASLCSQESELRTVNPSCILRREGRGGGAVTPDHIVFTN